ncbi:MAG: nucleoside triphosphate pyrophosphohydrolase [Bacillota bacterium]|nr:nucleoside triphosphate pyrophosphohydrolase [Bacillota bacterium]
MAKIVVVGLGPGDIELITKGVWRWITGPYEIFLRTEKHPVVEQLRNEQINIKSFDQVYDNEDSFGEVYNTIVTTLIEQAQLNSTIVYGVPGHPMVAEATVVELIKRGQALGVEVELVPGMSFLDACYSLLQIDPSSGMVIHDGLQLKVEELDLSKGQIICQVYNNRVASDIKLTLMEKLPDEYLVTVVTAAGIPELESVAQVPLYQLDRLTELNHLTSVYIPPHSRRQDEQQPWDNLCHQPNASLAPIVNVMEELRGEKGCPWDREQTHDTLKKYLIEETFEVIEAIEEKNMYKFCDELGDLLLQIVFHAQIAKENNGFCIEDVVTAITNKMIRRHPHVFGNVAVSDSQEVLNNWDEIKRMEQEKADGSPQSVLKVPLGLPGLMKAQKLQQQAAKVGFDWPDTTGVMTKIQEELDELVEAMALEEQEHTAEELGDLLFALVNLARFLNLEAEDIMQKSCSKFVTRFRLMEEQARNIGQDLKNIELEQQEILWEKAKKCQKIRK